MSSTYFEATIIVVIRSLWTFRPVIRNSGSKRQNRSIYTYATTYTDGPALVYLKILSRYDWIVISGVSLQSKILTLLFEPLWLTFNPHFLLILSFLAKVLSMREARTEMTKGVFESCWYEYEYTSYLSFLGEMTIFEEKAIFWSTPNRVWDKWRGGFVSFFGFEDGMEVIYRYRDEKEVGREIVYID